MSRTLKRMASPAKGYKDLERERAQAEFWDNIVVGAVMLLMGAFLLGVMG